MRKSDIYYTILYYIQYVESDIYSDVKLSYVIHILLCEMIKANDTF